MQTNKRVNIKAIQKNEDRKSNITDVPIFVKAMIYTVTGLLTISAAIPMLISFAVSITDNETLLLNGYSLYPEKLSLEAYRYIAQDGLVIWRAYAITIFVTVAGTLLGLAMMSMFSYVISRNSFPWKSQFTFFVYFTMLFSGGMVPTYMVVTQVFSLRDTLGALILPSCVSVMYILIMRTFMNTSIPNEVVESAKIDGAGDFLCYRKIVLPMALPTVMTVALFMSVSYWNDWYHGFLYIFKNHKIIPIQLLLKRIENDIQFFANEAATGMDAVEAEEFRKSLPTESFKMALVVVVVLPILAAFPAFQRFFVKGMTIGAVKG